MSRIVEAAEADTVRIARADGTTLQIPAACVLAINAVLRAGLVHLASVGASPVEDDATGEVWWEGDFDGRTFGAMATSPWGAFLSLAKELEAPNAGR